MSTRVRSFAKVNLGLAVGPARADGFHALLTVYQTVALHDFVTVTARTAERTAIVLEADHPGVPSSRRGDAEKNTAYRVVAGALERMGICAEVTLQIEKRLPVQGGMGAGSANAAAALLGLERELGGEPGRKLGREPGRELGGELGRELGRAERMALTADVGSDVPLFLLGGTVLGQGRGEMVSELPEVEGADLHCVVALPDVGVSTAVAFRALDAKGLTFQQEPDTLEKLSRVLSGVYGLKPQTDGKATGPSGITWAAEKARRGDLAENPEWSVETLTGVRNPLLALVRTGIENDFEEVVFSQHPSLRSTKRDLLGNPGSDGAVYAALSGSGSALFGLYDSLDSAKAAQHRVQGHGTRAIVTKTIGRHEYWHTMFAE